MSRFISLEKTMNETMNKPPQTKSILIVEDEIPYARFLQAVLEDHGFNSSVALNAKEALQTLQSDPPDLITLDLLMPDKTGIKLFRELRRRQDLTKTRIVIITGVDSDSHGLCSYDEFFRRVSAHGQVQQPDAYLTKPIAAEDLIREIRRILGD